MLVLLPMATGKRAGYDDQRSYRLRETVAYTIAYGVRTAANHARVVKGVRNQLADVEIEDASRDDARTGVVKTSKAKERGTRMTDQERQKKVIKGLECCMSGQPDGLGCSRVPCPYNQFGDCEGILHRDALALLKAQEPMVMTLEEVRCANEEPMWFESKGTFRGQKGFWVLSKGVSPSYVIRLIPTIGKDDTQLSLAAYGKVWRCWTSRPTDEQREAAKWGQRT